MLANQHLSGHRHMDIKELYKLNARLESRLDMIETEIAELNDLLLQCGFPSGITELRKALFSILKEDME